MMDFCLGIISGNTPVVQWLLSKKLFSVQSVFHEQRFDTVMNKFKSNKSVSKTNCRANTNKHDIIIIKDKMTKYKIH